LVGFELMDTAEAKVFSHSTSVIEPDLDLLCEITGGDFSGAMASNQGCCFVSKYTGNLFNCLAFEEVSLVSN
jgi:hypothetical protein